MQAIASLKPPALNVEEQPHFDSMALRRALGGYATGITIIAADHPERGLIGITVSSFAAVSLDPPLVLFNVARKAYSLPPLLDVSRFSINILEQDQHELSSRFACSGGSKWTDAPLARTPSGTPLIVGAAGAFECGHFARHPGGDHVIVVARVLHIGACAQGAPLIFHGSHYHRLGDALT